MTCVAFWLVSGLFLGIGAIAANPSGDAEGGFVGRIGDERSAARLAGYVVAPDLVEVARRHADEMRRQQRLHHNPRLGDEVQGWQAVGENVGVGPTVEAIHQKLMDSPSHRDNILSGRFTEVGVGVVADGDDLWVVQVFRLPQEAAPAAEPGTGAGSSSPAPAPPAEPSGNEPAPSQPSPRPAATATPAPAPAGAGTVRAAATTGGTPVSPSTSAPEPPTSAPPASLVAPPSEVPTTLAEASPSTADTVRSTAPAVDRASTSPAPAGGSTVVETDIRATGERQVTWPIAVAATMLMGVVGSLAVHVGGATIRALATTGRRTSLLDVWELALAG